jgi:hypothetical protein
MGYGGRDSREWRDGDDLIGLGFGFSGCCAMAEDTSLFRPAMTRGWNGLGLLARRKKAC